MHRTENSFQYRELPAAEELQTCVANFWSFRVSALGPDGYDHHIPPDGCVSLITRYPEGPEGPHLLLLGPRTETFVVPIETRDQYFGVRFWPHAAFAILGDRMDAAVNFVGPAQLILGEQLDPLMLALPSEFDERMLVRIFEQRLLGLPGTSRRAEEFVRAAVERIVATGGGRRIQDIASDLGVSLRHLQRRFRAATGLTPKQFARLRRFRKALVELLSDEPRPWIEVAYDAGFSDQAHLSREFSQMIGLTAEELRQKQQAIEHQDISN